MSRNYDLPGQAPRELGETDLSLLRAWKGVASGSVEDAALREHVLSVWADIKKSAHVYRCVQSISFLLPRSPLHPNRAELLKLRSENDGTLLEVGCAFGQDVRQAADVTDSYWNAGLRLFGDDEAPAKLAGVRTSFRDWASPADNSLATDISAPFKNALSGVLCFYVLHVLSREQTDALLARLRSVIAPGGLLIGGCVGASDAPVEWGPTPDGKAVRWLHSKESLHDALIRAGFASAEVALEVAPGEETERKAVEKAEAAISTTTPSTRYRFTGRV